jgi:hypothetical protein
MCPDKPELGELFHQELVMMFSRFRSLISNLFGRNKVERELDAEVNSYLDQLIDEKIAAGANPAEAHRAAFIEFGGAEQVKENVRDVRFGSIVEQLWQDARYALRMLRKNPGFTAIAVITLALGIGVNTAIFSLVNGILLRPLPFAQPDRLVRLVQSQRQLGLDNWNLSQASFVALRDNTRSLETVAAYSGGGANLTGDGDPPRLSSEEARQAARSLKRFAERGRIVPEVGDPGIRELFVRRYRTRLQD